MEPNTEELVQIKVVLENLVNTIRLIEYDGREKSDTIMALGSRVFDLEDAIQEKDTYITRLEESLGAQYLLFVNRMEKLEERIKELRERVENAEIGLDGIGKDIKDVNTTCDCLRVDLRNLEQDFDNLDTKVSSLE
jgi:chromosome segregation ATPase